MRNAAVWLLLPIFWVGKWIYEYKGWMGVGILAAFCCSGYLLYRIKPVIARVRERYRERKRIRRFASRQPRINYDETEAELLRRLRISKRKAREIGWNYLRWSSYPPFRRPHLSEFPGVPFGFGDREHLAQIYFYEKK